MQSIKHAVLEGAKKNLELYRTTETTVREVNIANVTADVEALVDHATTGSPAPVVQIKVAPTGKIEALQAFIEKVNVLAPDANGAIAIEDHEFVTYVKDQSTSVSSKVAILVLR